MKKRLKEMEEEAAALREMQAKVEKEMGAVQGPFFSFYVYYNHIRDLDLVSFTWLPRKFGKEEQVKF